MSVVAEVCADLSGHVLVSEHPDEQFYAASTMKLPVMIALFRRYEAGALDLDRPVPVVSTFTSVHDGSPFRVDADDADEDLLAAEGGQLPARQLIERMITLSSNNATNLVLGLITIDEVQRVVDDLGARHTVIARPIGDQVAAAAGIQNLVTAADLVAIMAAVATDRAAGPDSCREMLGILTRQQRRDALPAGIPGHVRSASKGGWVEKLRHDVAVVWPDDGEPYCQAVCTSGLDDEAALAEIRYRAGVAYRASR